MALEFRSRGGAIQVVRTSQNADTGQPESDRLGAIPLARMRVSDDLAAKLSSEEKVEVDARVDAAQALATLRQKAAAHTIAWSANDAVRYLESVTDPAELEALRGAFADAVAILRRGAKPRAGDAEGTEAKRTPKGKRIKQAAA